MAIEFGRLHQAHDRCRPFARPQGPGEQPVVAAHGDGPDLLFDPVVVCALLRHDLVGRCKPDPATLAPAGSTGGDSGGNK